MILTANQRKYVRYLLQKHTDSLDEALQEFPLASISIVRRVSNDAHYRHVTAWVTYEGAQQERKELLFVGDDPSLYVLQGRFDLLVQERLCDERQGQYLGRTDVMLVKAAANEEMFTGALEVLLHSSPPSLPKSRTFPSSPTT